MSLFAPILHQNATSVVASLTLTSGSHSGSEVPLHVGYYMIGRHAECQIRPKSHSVSRRHTLLCRDDSTIQAFDLGSTNGTLVNGQPLKANEFMDLHDGDRLRCGCTEFRVSIKQANHQSKPAPHSRTLSKAESDTTEESSIVGSAAWQDFDIVAFLEAEDEAEEQQRYAKLCRGYDEDDSANVLDDDIDHSASPNAHAVTLIHDTGKAAASCDSSGLSARELRIARIRAKIEEQRAKECPEQRNFHVVNRPGFRASKANDKKSDALKLTLTLVLACVSSGVFVYSTYQFMRGASVRVIKDID